MYNHPTLSCSLPELMGFLWIKQHPLKMGHSKTTTATMHHKIISNEGKGAGITNHVLTSMEYLKLKLPTVRTYLHTLPPCWSTDWSVYPSSLDLPIQISRASLIAQLVKNLPVMQEARAQFLSPEDPLEKEMATHSGTLAWRIPWTEEPGRLQSRDHKSLI